MKAKRILVYFEKSKLAACGGPAGYLYNLYNGLNSIKKNDDLVIDFLETEDSSFLIRNKSKIKKIPILGKLLHFVNKKRVSRNKIRDIFFNNKNVSKVNLNEYDAVHFHSCLEMFKARESLEKYKGKVLLTSHTPKISHLEIIDDLTNSDKKKYKKYLSNISVIDYYAFNRADYCIFPVEDALECYFNTWEPFKKIYSDNQKKFRFIPTGILPKNAVIDEKSIRNKYCIPEDAFLISYVGRHNEVKGYDSLLRIGGKILNECPESYFIVAGNEGPLFGLKNNRWIEVGWTNDSASLISAANVFILPNKETYFDLVMLEVLSLGKVVVCSNTGGNKYFSRIGSEGIFAYNSEEECVKIIEQLQNKNPDEIKELENSNKMLFNKHFSNEMFVNGYLKLYKRILEEK